MQRDITCCFTGHRNLKQPLSDLQNALKKHIVFLVEQGFVNFASGGALGFDLLAAKAILDLKKTLPHIRLFMVLPCPEQDRFWSAAQKADYRAVLAAADKIVYTASHYHKGCMLRRNRYLVDSAACVLAYLEHNSGGTKYTVDYAEKSGTPIFFINDFDVFPHQLSLLA